MIVTHSPDLDKLRREWDIARSLVYAYSDYLSRRYPAATPAELDRLNDLDHAACKAEDAWRAAKDGAR